MSVTACSTPFLSWAPKAALPPVIDQANATTAKLPALAKDLIGSGALFPSVKPVQK